MEWWQLVLVISVIGFVSMVEICAIIICVGNMLDKKMKAKTILEYKIFKKEMTELKEVIISIIQEFKPEIKDKDNHISYSKMKPVAKLAKEDPDDDWEDILNDKL